MMKKIWLSPPHLNGSEFQAIQHALEGNWIAPAGPQIEDFESKIANHLADGRQGSMFYPVALNSGTSAIHLALKLLGVGKGDVVICQSLSFVATVNPVLYQQADPVFVDSEAETFNLSPYYLEEAITDQIQCGKKPKAIIAVHLYGVPYQVEQVHLIANKYDIPVIEDAAEALGSKFKNAPCGTFGDLGIFSFNGNKIITTSAGGALVCRDHIQKEKAIFWSTQAKERADYYLHRQVGYNYRISNILAAIGSSQMQVLKERVEKKRAIHRFYTSYLNELKGFTMFTEPGEHFYSNYWLSVVRIDPEKAGITNRTLMKSLARSGIECRRVWKPLHTQPLFRKFPYFGKRTAEGFFEDGLCLPSGTALTCEELKFIKQTILSSARNE